MKGEVSSRNIASDISDHFVQFCVSVHVKKLRNFMIHDYCKFSENSLVKDMSIVSMVMKMLTNGTLPFIKN